MWFLEKRGNLWVKFRAGGAGNRKLAFSYKPHSFANNQEPLLPLLLSAFYEDQYTTGKEE
jgi:hypothetical protein